MNEHVEITSKAFWAIVGAKKVLSVDKTELATKTHWYTMGCLLTEVHNHASDAVQYYIRDINA